MAGPFDFTGQNIENTYQRLVQVSGSSYYDGTGSLLDLGGGAQDLQSVLTQGASSNITIVSTAETAISASGTSSFALVQTPTIESSTSLTLKADNIFLVKIEDDTKFTINNQGVTILGEQTSTPTAVAGGIYYSSSAFFVGME